MVDSIVQSTITSATTFSRSHGDEKSPPLQQGFPVEELLLDEDLDEELLEEEPVPLVLDVDLPEVDVDGVLDELLAMVSNR